MTMPPMGKRRLKARVARTAWAVTMRWKLEREEG